MQMAIHVSHIQVTLSKLTLRHVAVTTFIASLRRPSASSPLFPLLSVEAKMAIQSPREVRNPFNRVHPEWMDARSRRRDGVGCTTPQLDMLEEGDTALSLWHSVAPIHHPLLQLRPLHPATVKRDN